MKILKKHIECLRYAEGLKGYEEIICYGAAFFQKQVKLRLK